MKNRLQFALVAGCALLAGSRFGFAGDGTFDNIYVGTSTQAGTVQVYGTQAILGSASSLGIGTAAPKARLGVVGRNSITGQASFGDVGDAGFISFINGNGQPYAVLGYHNSATENSVFDISSGGGSGAISFDVGGANGVMYLTTSGKLGVGTTNPGSRVTIQSSSTVDVGSQINALELTDSGMAQNNIGGAMGILFNQNPGGVAHEASRQAAIYSISESIFSNNVGLGFYTEQSGGPLTERLRIDAFGNIGIGTSFPHAKFDVVGGGKFTDVVNLYNGTGATSPSIVLDPVNCQILLNGQSLLAPNASGNVGIGTTSPAYKLQVNGTTKIGDGSNVSLGGAYGLFSSASGNAGLTLNKDSVNQYASLDFLTGGSTSTGWSIQMQPNSTALSFVDRANNATSLSILNGGNVGIGTNSPQAKLHVYNSAVTTASGNEVLRLGTGYNDSIPGAGGYINFTESHNTPVGQIRSIQEATQQIGLSFSTYNWGLTERVRISNSGNVGIGTTTPQAKLDVNGSANVSGAATIAGATNISGSATISGTTTLAGAVTIVKRQGDIVMGVYGNGNGD
jgi:hypothetical protein